MAKGSIRKKGKKWYYRFYVAEDASGNLVQKEFAGTESKSETERECYARLWRIMTQKEFSSQSRQSHTRTDA